MPDENCRHLTDYIPFIGMAAGATSPLITKLIEIALVGAVSVGASLYVGVQVVKTELSGAQERIDRMDAKMDKNLERLERSLEKQISTVSQQVEKVDNRVEKIYRDLYAPRGASNEKTYMYPYASININRLCWHTDTITSVNAGGTICNTGTY